MMPMKRLFEQVFWLGLLVGGCSLAAAPGRAGDEEELFFAKRVLPLLKTKCFGCHGNDPAAIQGGLDMRSLPSLLRGGDSGEPAIGLGRPEQSPLYLAVLRHDPVWSAMPPKENDLLSAEEVGAIERWIRGGAVWPDEARLASLAAEKDPWRVEQGMRVATTGALDADWANRSYEPAGLWAYQPVNKPAVPVDQHPIDYLIGLRRNAELPLAPPSDRQSLLRRLTFDLIGLPPTPEELEDFLRDPDSDAVALKKVIDRLLASPHYGEHWGRHWLDVVRYADTAGFANDYDRGNAWRYRDYVVRAFNADKPYDRFIREQVAGDEMLEAGVAGPEADEELVIATGFLRMGPWELTGMEVARIARQRFLDDVTNSIGETFLAHSLQCARCHDHKFDPIPTHDYYAVQACFATTQLSERPAAFLQEENVTNFEERRHLQRRKEALIEELRELDQLQLTAAQQWYEQQRLDSQAWEEAVTRSQQPPSKGQARRNRDYQSIFSAARAMLLAGKVAEDLIPPKGIGFRPEHFGRERVARKGLERLKWEMERYEPYALAVYDGLTPQVSSVTQPTRMPAAPMEQGELEETAILSGGDPFSPTTKVQPGVLSAVAAFNPDLPVAVSDHPIGRRRALADWIADPRNPLTTRTIVNRIWMWHFGQPIAGNPNNFGSTGKRPTHPELLDYLAAALVENRWSLKAIHRLILTSAAYQRAGTLVDTAGFARQELEANYAVFKPRRLTAEELRDAMLYVSGELNLSLGGIPNRPEINFEAALQPRQVMGTFAAAWVPNPLPPDRHRRSLYALRIRGLRDPFMEVFNEPAPDFSCEARDVSTVTPQAFSLFNAQSAHDRALAFADRVLRETVSPNRRQRSEQDWSAPPDRRGMERAVERVWLLAFGRPPRTHETEKLVEHWQRMIGEQQKIRWPARRPPLTVERQAVEENTGEKFSFTENLYAYEDFVPDLQPQDVDAITRALADICLVVFNSNEFAYLY
jgi:hypothetical protein